VRRWFAAAGYAEQAFDAADDALFAVGVHRFTGESHAPVPGQRLFRFL
jgi:hypothetical protein